MTDLLNGSRRRKLLGGSRGAYFPLTVFKYFISKFPFPGFLSYSDRILANSILLGWSLANRRIISSIDFKLESFIYCYYYENLTDFRKTVETGADSASLVTGFYDIKVLQERTETSTPSFLTLFANLHQLPHSDTAKMRLIQHNHHITTRISTIPYRRNYTNQIDCFKHINQADNTRLNQAHCLHHLD